MASQLPRTAAASLLAVSGRPNAALRIAPTLLRCLHETSVVADQQKQQQQYERKPLRLSYEHGDLKQTRPQPRAPFAVRIRKPFIVNDDPAKLDAMYMRLFGKDMELSMETKWQAVTHKSFDHGRQPFNSKLRFLGKRLLQMQAAFHLLNSPLKVPAAEPKEVVYKSVEGEVYQTPEPFVHKDYKSLDNVTGRNIEDTTSPLVLLPLIEEVGLNKVMRWKPMDNTNLKGSGEGGIAIEALHSIIGAVALEKGGEAAIRFICDRILK